jgi:acyl-CoA synthetase (AMP-forming)/AMP-acid ligase II
MGFYLHFDAFGLLTDFFDDSYEKRRTIIMSQYLGPEQTEQLRRQIEAASNPHAPQATTTSPAQDPRGPSPVGLSQQQPYYNQYGQPPSHVSRFQEQQLGYRPDLQQSGSLTLHSPQDESSRSGTMLSVDYRFNPPANQLGYDDDPDASRRSTMLDSQQSFFSDFAGQQIQEGAPRDSYGGPSARYSADNIYSPSANVAPPMLSMQDLPPSSLVDCQLPLEPREVPFTVYDPHNTSLPMTKFDDIGSVLKHRAKTTPRHMAYWVVDNKGKEVASITFEKLASRAEKVSETIKTKANLYRGDRVALVYRDSEVIDFAVALFGCFLAGVVGVPMNGVDGDFAKLQLLLTTTQAHLALTTEENLKKFERGVSTRKWRWPNGVEWWKTNEFGSHHGKSRVDDPQLPAPDLAYIEFSRAPTGDLRGVVLSHRTIMRQMSCLQAILSTIPKDSTVTSRNSSGGMPSRPRVETILSYLDPREGVGLILGTLLCVYGGHTSVWMNSSTVETPGLYAHLITKYKTTVMVADYPGLMLAVFNYQTDPMATRNFRRNAEPNFSSVRICLIDTLTIDCDFHEVLADRWLKPLRNPRAREIVSPMLCLPEHGGMIITVRDWIGGEERMGCPLSKLEQEEEEEKEEEPQQNNGYSSLLGGGTKVQKVTKPKSRTELSEVLLDKEALIRNEVRVLAMGADASKRAGEPGTLRIGGFGFPIPDATLAVVDPETNLLCPQFCIGEIWVDSPSLSGGFWALPKHTETIFHARPYRFVEGNPTPVMVEPEFLRTGLLGCVIEGKLFILGLYEDRIRQRVEGMDPGLPMEIDHRFFFVQHLVVSIMKNVLKIYDW